MLTHSSTTNKHYHNPTPSILKGSNGLELCNLPFSLNINVKESLLDLCIRGLHKHTEIIDSYYFPQLVGGQANKPINLSTYRRAGTNASYIGKVGN